MKPANDQLTILLVEDDDVDILAIRRVFDLSGYNWPIVVAHNGIEALEVLRGGESRAPLQKPYLIILDLNMPRMNGLEFLAALREDECLKASIVFVLTTSTADIDVAAAYAYNVAGFISKRGVEDTASHLARLIEIYSTTVHFPPA